MTAMNSLAITQVDLHEHLKSAQAYLDNARERVQLASHASGSYAGSQTMDDAVSFSGLIADVDTDDSLMTDTQLHTLRAVRAAMQMGFHLAEQYRLRSGAASFDSAHGLSDAQKGELNEKMQTAAAVTLFSFARYLQWDMYALSEHNTFVGNIPATYDKVNLASPKRAIMGAMYHLAKHVEKEVNGSDERLVAAVVGFAQVLQEAVLNRVVGLKHVDVFTGVSYTLEETDFSIAGFNVESFGTTKSAEVKRVERDDVIGNSEAIIPLFNSIDKLMLYDVDRQMNPLLALGNFPAVMGYDGDPGNGKTYTMSAGATYFTDCAKERGLPYKVMVVPGFVDKYQGESKKAAERWCIEFMDPTSIKFGIGDEFEQIMGDHGSENASEGSKEVSTTFLKAFDGVETIQRGHSLFLYGTNYRELINPAFLSRTNLRAFVGGAETLDDFVRFIVLMLKKVHGNFPGLVNFKNIDWDMNLRAPQVPDSAEDLKIFVDPSATIDQVYAQAQSMHAQDDIYFLARFFWLMKRRFSAFSLRDCKNTIEAATSQVGNFEVPKDFITNPALYADKTFEEKQGLITELARGHVASLGTDFVSLINDRAHYYAADALRTADVKHTRAVKELADRMLVQTDADAKIQQLLAERRAFIGNKAA